MIKCEKCQRSFKNELGLRTHIGHAHKHNKSKNKITKITKNSSITLSEGIRVLELERDGIQRAIDLLKAAF